jgi:hypothetical protein
LVYSGSIPALNLISIRVIGIFMTSWLVTTTIPGIKEMRTKSTDTLVLMRIRNEADACAFSAREIDGPVSNH